MIRRMVLTGLSLCVLVGAGAVFLTKAGVLHGAGSATRPAATDYQKVADTAGWGWLAEMADPLGCITQCGDKYDIRFLSKKDDRHALTITILADGKDVFTWEGHRHSVFRVLGDRLYFAEFNTGATGGNVVAVDLKTGKKLWTSPLKALGPIDHSAYRNLMNLDVNDEVVSIWGNESLGRYVEFKSTATGKTLGNKVFPTPATSPKEVLRGLQALTRVQLKLPDVTKTVRTEVVKQLREKLPQLNTAGSSDDWTLEFVFGTAWVVGWPMRSVGPTPLVRVHACHCRLFRTVVVDGRVATAVAYEGPQFAEKAPWSRTRNKDWLIIPGEQSDPESKRLLLGAIAGFAKAWRVANPKAEQK